LRSAPPQTILAAALPASDNPPRVKRRRVHVQQVRPGVVELPEREAHHLRDVLRLKVGDVVELFDDQGAVAEADLIRCGAGGVAVAVAQVQATETTTTKTDATSIQIVVASAVPKGERADWMIEKLSELGVSRFIPLAAARSVVLPEGKNKRDRWERIAIEAARQSRRSGVMSVEPLTKLDDALAGVHGSGMVLSTADDARPILDVVRSSILQSPSSFTLFIGPEGGWTDAELAACAAAGGLTSARLTATILRVETAAVAAAAVVAAAAMTRAGESHR
jgi:16S rRNA (uracil1498-N3)-methyltransferase